LTPQNIKIICEALLVGSTYTIACGYAGVDYTTFRKWMQKGEAASSGKYFDFFDKIKKTEAKAAVLLLAKIQSAAADGKYKAAIWLLERRYRNDYGPTKPKAVDGTSMTDEEIYAELQDLRSRAPGVGVVAGDGQAGVIAPSGGDRPN